MVGYIGDRRPSGSNADEWNLFLDQHKDDPEFVAVQIAEAIETATKNMRQKLRDARNRLDTIRETHPDISLDHDIERIDAVLNV